MKKFNKNKALSKLNFKRNKNKYTKYVMSISLVAVIVFGVIYFSHSKFTSNDNLIVKDSTVKIEDYNLSFYYEEEKITDVPEKGTVSVDKVVCNNDATAVWDEKNWNITISDVTKSNTRCSIYFIEKRGMSANDLLLLASQREDVMIDDYGNARYVGANPNNYITFNDEEWRVVGVMKDMEVVNDDGTTSKQDLIKIVRNESIGNIPWDSKNENDWTNATLKTLLNGDYLNNQGTYNQSSTIKSLANNLDNIATVRWNIGSMDSAEINIHNLYLKERGTVGSAKNPSVTTWDGKVALLYPSDYGYLNTGVLTNDDTGESTSCLNTNIDTWYNNTCSINLSWLHSESPHWMLTGSAHEINYVLFMYNQIYNDENYNVYISLFDAYVANTNVIGVQPALYLKSNVKLTGTGEQGANSFKIL